MFIKEGKITNRNKERYWNFNEIRYFKIIYCLENFNYTVIEELEEFKDSYNILRSRDFILK